MGRALNPPVVLSITWWGLKKLGHLANELPLGFCILEFYGEIELVLKRVFAI